jgi:hypothetical protein
MQAAFGTTPLLPKKTWFKRNSSVVRRRQTKPFRRISDEQLGRGKESGACRGGGDGRMLTV